MDLFATFHKKMAMALGDTNGRIRFQQLLELNEITTGIMSAVGENGNQKVWSRLRETEKIVKEAISEFWKRKDDQQELVTSLVKVNLRMAEAFRLVTFDKEDEVEEESRDQVEEKENKVVPLDPGTAVPVPQPVPEPARVVHVSRRIVHGWCAAEFDLDMLLGRR